MIQYQGEMFTQVLVKDALKVYYDFNSDNFDTTKYSIGGVIFTHKELQPFCDDIERFILYTCYFTRFDIDFSFIVKINSVPENIITLRSPKYSLQLSYNL